LPAQRTRARTSSAITITASSAHSHHGRRGGAVTRVDPAGSVCEVVIVELLF